MGKDAWVRCDVRWETREHDAPLIVLSAEQDMSTLEAVGCQLTSVTFFWWPSRVKSLAVMGAAIPSAGTDHTLMVVSSEPVAITFGAKGLKSMSSTSPLWPCSMCGMGSTRPTASHFLTKTLPPAPAHGMAQNRELHLMMLVSLPAVEGRKSW